MSYNGWSNYETWNVALWLDSEYGSQSYWSERARETYEGAEPDPPFTRAERATLDLAEELEQEHEDNNPLLGQPSTYSDMLNMALKEVNWYEVAESILEPVLDDIED